MLSLLRARDPPRTSTSHLTTITYEDGASVAAFHAHSAAYLLTITLPPAGTPTFNAPPLHYHAHQLERFHVHAGSARFLCDDADFLAHAGTDLTVPPRAYHRFESAGREPLVLSVRLDAAEGEAEEGFFRNLFGYLEDCRVAGAQPSLFQLERLLVRIDCPLAVAPAWMPYWARRQFDWAFMMVVGKVVGGWLLGYKDSYPEYYNPGKKAI